MPITKRVRDTVVGIHNRAREIVGRVDLELGPGTRVRREIDAVQAGIAQALVVVAHVHAHAHDALLPCLAALLHFSPQRLVLCWGVLAALGLDPVPSLFAHRFYVGVVHVCVAAVQQLLEV